MCHRNVTSTIIATTMILSAAAAQAADTSTTDGRATFTGQGEIQCFSVFYESGGIRNFCLRNGETEEMDVRQGDTYCSVNANHAPPNNCTRKPIPVN